MVVENFYSDWYTVPSKMWWTIPKISKEPQALSAPPKSRRGRSRQQIGGDKKTAAIRGILMAADHFLLLMHLFKSAYQKSSTAFPYTQKNVFQFPLPFDDIAHQNLHVLSKPVGS